MKYTVAAGFAILAILAWLLPRQSGGDRAKDEAAAVSADAYQTVCSACHGDRGQGNMDIGAPSIASLPRWYVEKQVDNFRKGLRGDHPADHTGQAMRAAILALTDKRIDEALDTLEAFPVVEHEPTITADLERGAHLYRENCMECHRFNGRGEISFGSSHLAGLQDWYLLAQWNKFKAGTRGYHPEDEDGAKMRKAAGYLSNDDEARDVILYISTLSKQYPEDKNTKIQTPKTKE
ncbi:MAG: c-type cytochrome [Akkermansiaceae bacterium]|nr:c-type cytochrome [Akkermansiaceae bacterium]